MNKNATLDCSKEKPSIEDQILAWLLLHDRWEARAAAKMVGRHCTVALRYAEYTGGYMRLDELFKVLSDECFAIPESDERPKP